MLTIHSVVLQCPLKDDVVFPIRRILVSAAIEEKIWSKRHVTLEEVDEVCASDSLPLRGRDESYALYGRTEAGRYLIVFLYPREHGVYALATARDMDDAERRRYQRSKGR